MDPNPQRRLAAEFDQGQVPSISCVNRATTDLGVDWKQLIAALDEYANGIFAPVWGTPAKIIDAGNGPDIPPKHWGMLFLDDADAQDALGYHDLTRDGLPLSKVFVKTTLADGQKVSVTAAQELAAMLVDPAIQMGAIGPDGQTWYAYEMADAVEREEFEVRGVAMSNFVYPAWFEAFRAPGSAKFDHLGTCERPFELRPGGYMLVFRNGTWTQIFGDRQTAQRFNAARHFRTQARPHRMRRNQILEAQRQLRDLGFYRGQLDGMHGRQTTQALNDYRKKYGGHDHELTPGLASLLFGKLPIGGNIAYGDVGGDNGGEGLPSPKPVEERHLNAWIDTEKPEVNEPFQVSINIGASRSPLASVRFIEPHWGASESISLVISLSSLQCDVEPSWQELDLPRRGDSDTVTFTIVATAGGDQEVSIRVYLARRMILLQSLTFVVGVRVVEAAGAGALI